MIWIVRGAFNRAKQHISRANGRVHSHLEWICQCSLKFRFHETTQTHRRQVDRIYHGLSYDGGLIDSTERRHQVFDIKSEVLLARMRLLSFEDSMKWMQANEADDARHASDMRLVLSRPILSQYYLRTVLFKFLIWMAIIDDGTFASFRSTEEIKINTHANVSPVG